MVPKNKKSEPAKTVLTISMGFLVVFAATKKEWALIVSLAVGVIGIFSTYLSSKIEFLWMKLAQILGMIVPKILLSVIFYGFVFPLALLQRILKKKDPLQLKKAGSTTYVTTNKQFDKASFEVPW